MRKEKKTRLEYYFISTFWDDSQIGSYIFVRVNLVHVTFNL